MTENQQNVLSLINEKQKKNKLLTIRSRTELLKIFTDTKKDIYRRIRVQTNEMRIVLFIRIKYCNEKRNCVFCMICRLSESVGIIILCLCETWSIWMTKIRTGHVF